MINKSKLCSVLILAGCLFVFNSCTQDQDTGQTSQQDAQESIVSTSGSASDSDDGELTPEEVLAQMDAAEGVGTEQGPVTVTIISPEEKTFSQGQARHYQSLVEGLETGFTCSCDWKFYLNQYDQEELYEQMDDRPCTGSDREAGLTCGFTSTFIQDRGDLRVVVSADVLDWNKETVETATAEREYQVL